MRSISTEGGDGLRARSKLACSDQTLQAGALGGDGEEDDGEAKATPAKAGCGVRVSTERCCIHQGMGGGLVGLERSYCGGVFAFAFHGAYEF